MADYSSNFRSREGVPNFIAIAWGDPLPIRHKSLSLKTTLFGLHFCCRKYPCIFNHFYAIRPESYRIRWNYAAVRPITPFKVIQGHRVWYQSKLICDFLLVISSNLPPIFHRFRDTALERSKIATFFYPSLSLTPRLGVPLGRSP